MITNIANYVLLGKSKGLSAATIEPPTTSDNSLTPTINYYYYYYYYYYYHTTKIRIKFAGSCLKQSKISYTHGNIVNIYIVYELGSSGSNNSDPTL